MDLNEVKALVDEQGIEFFLCSFVEMTGAPKAGSGYMLTDESGKSKLLACQTEERQNDPECHHA